MKTRTYTRPPEKLCYPKVKFNWTGVEWKALTKMKKIVGRDILLSYHIFSEEFIIHIYDNKKSWASDWTKWQSH